MPFTTTTALTARLIDWLDGKLSGSPVGGAVSSDVRTLSLGTTINGLITDIVQLGSAAAGAGAALIGYQDANASLVGATVAAALDELATPLTLTVGVEAADVIAVTIAGPAQAAQYVAKLYDANMLDSLVGAFTLAETGAGAEVSATAKPTLLFTTDAAGAAVISATDVASGSGATLYLAIYPVGTTGGLKGGPAAVAAITFD